MYGYDSYFNTFFTFFPILSSLIMIILAHTIIVKFYYSSFCSREALKDPCGSFLNPICEQHFLAADRTHHSTKYIHHSVFSDLTSFKRYDSLTVSSCTAVQCTRRRLHGLYNEMCWWEKRRKRMWNKLSENRGSYLWTTVYQRIRLSISSQCCTGKSESGGGLCSLQPTSMSLYFSVYSPPSCYLSPPLATLLPSVSLHLPPPPCSHYFLSSFVVLLFCPVCPSSLSFWLISSISQSFLSPPLLFPPPPA